MKRTLHQLCYLHQSSSTDTAPIPLTQYLVLLELTTIRRLLEDPQNVTLDFEVQIHTLWVLNSPCHKKLNLVFYSKGFVGRWMSRWINRWLHRWIRNITNESETSPSHRKQSNATISTVVQTGKPVKNFVGDLQHVRACITRERQRLESWPGSAASVYHVCLFLPGDLL